MLKSAVIYGTNGSGKSNFVDAISFVKNLVLNSINYQPGHGINQKPHKLEGIGVGKDSGDWPKSEKYKSFQVPLVKVEEAMVTLDSNECFFEYLNSCFSRDVFLSSESMKEQMNLIGVEFTIVMEDFNGKVLKRQG